ncbi:hypothetical protein NG795_18300 [Laspinema sp. D3]|nr:hypothetical protein [Laspinema sp. D2c]
MQHLPFELPHPPTVEHPARSAFVPVLTVISVANPQVRSHPTISKGPPLS